MNDFRRKIISGFAWEAGTKIIAQVISWISTVWIARILSPDDYGLVAISGIFTGLCLIFAVMGLSNALINKKVVHEHDKANVFWAGVVLAALIYLFLYAISPFVATFYETPELTNIIRVAGLMVVISPLSVVPRALLARALAFKALALTNMVIGLVGTIIALVLAIQGWGYWALILSTVIAQALELIILFCITSYIPTKPRHLEEFYPMCRYGMHILGARLVSVLNKNWPVILISTQIGKTQTGFFQMANTLAGMPSTKIGEIFTKIAFPAFSKIQGDLKQTKQVFLSMHRFLFMVIAPMFVGIALTAEEFIPILVGEKWLDIVFPLQIICIANIFSGSALIIPHVFEGLGDAKSSFRYELLITILSPIALLMGAPWGFKGMLLTWALTVPISYFYLLNVLFRMINLSFLEFIKSVAITGLAVIVMAVSIQLMDILIEISDLDFLLLVKIVVGCLSYLISYVVFGKKELKSLITLIRVHNETT